MQKRNKKGMSIRNTGNQSDSLCRNAFSAACKAELLGSGGLYAHAVHVHAQVGGDIGSHGIDVRPHFGSLGDDGNIDIDGSVALAGKERHHLTEQDSRVGSTPALVGIGEMQAYVAERGSTQQGVAQGMESHVGIAVAEQALAVRYVDAAYYAAPSFRETVYVKTVSYPE